MEKVTLKVMRAPCEAAVEAVALSVAVLGRNQAQTLKSRDDIALGLRRVSLLDSGARISDSSSTRKKRRWCNRVAQLPAVTRYFMPLPSSPCQVLLAAYAICP